MHILLFILLFIITIIVFGLSVVGLILKAIFGIGHRFRLHHDRDKTNPDVARTSKATVREHIVRRIMKRKYSPTTFQEKSIKRYSPRMKENM